MSLFKFKSVDLTKVGVASVLPSSGVSSVIGYTYKSLGDVQPEQKIQTLLDEDLRLRREGWLAVVERLSEKCSDDARLAASSHFNRLRILFLEAKKNGQETLDVPGSYTLIEQLEKLRKHKLKIKKEPRSGTNNREIDSVDFTFEPLLERLIIHATAAHNTQVFNANALDLIESMSWMKNPGSSEATAVSGSVGVHAGFNALGVTSVGNLSAGLTGSLTNTRARALGAGGSLTESRGGAIGGAINVSGSVLKNVLALSGEVSAKYDQGRHESFKSIKEFATSQSPLHIHYKWRKYLIGIGYLKGVEYFLDHFDWQNIRKQHIAFLDQAHSNLDGLQMMLSVLGQFGPLKDFPRPIEGSVSHSRSVTVAGAVTGSAAMLAGVTASFSGSLAASHTSSTMTIERALSVVLLLDQVGATDAEFDELAQRFIAWLETQPSYQVLWGAPEEVEKRLGEMGGRLQLLVQSQEMKNDQFYSPSLQKQMDQIAKNLLKNENVNSPEQLLGKWSCELVLYALIFEVLEKEGKWDNRGAMAPIINQMKQALMKAPRFSYNAAKLKNAQGISKTISTTAATNQLSLTLNLVLAGAMHLVGQANWRDTKSPDPKKADPTSDGEVLQLSVTLQGAASSAILTPAQLNEWINKMAPELQKAGAKFALPPDLVKVLGSLQFSNQRGTSRVLHLFRPRTMALSDAAKKFLGSIPPSGYRLQEYWSMASETKTLGGTGNIPIVPGVSAAIGASVSNAKTVMDKKYYGGYDVYWLLNQYFSRTLPDDSTSGMTLGQLTKEQPDGMKRLLGDLKVKESRASLELLAFIARYGLFAGKSASPAAEWLSSSRTPGNLTVLLDAMKPCWKYEIENGEPMVAVHRL